MFRRPVLTLALVLASLVLAALVLVLVILSVSAGARGFVDLLALRLQVWLRQLW